MINVIISLFFFYHLPSRNSITKTTTEKEKGKIEKEKEKKTKIWKELDINQGQNRLTLVTYARNKAELNWYTNEYQKKLKDLSIEEKPYIICVLCQLKLNNEEEYLKNDRLKFINSHDPHCDISKLYKIGLSHVESELFMFIEPGFTFSLDLFQYLIDSKFSHQIDDKDEFISYMLLAFESTLENKEFPKTGEYRTENIKMYKKKKIRNFYDLRNYHLYSDNVQNFIIPQILEPNMKNLRSNQESIDVPIFKDSTSDIKLPRIYWFLLETKRFKFDMILLLDKLYYAYKYELYSRPLITRERIIQEMSKIQDSKVHLILEKAVFYHKVPREKGTTLAVHLSFDRIKSLQKTIERWNVIKNIH